MTGACLLTIHRRKVSSLYIAADSRINWNGDTRYDGHRKVYASVRHPEIDDLTNLEWRDDNFERVDVNTGKLSQNT